MELCRQGEGARVEAHWAEDLQSVVPQMEDWEELSEERCRRLAAPLLGTISGRMQRQRDSLSDRYRKR